jgi:shikimate dehydrogenase
MNKVKIMNIKELFDNNIIKRADLPKNNYLDLNKMQDYKMLIIPIDHDYPGGSATMHNAVFEKYLPHYRTMFVVANPDDTKQLFETLKNDPIYVGGGVGSGFKDKVIPYLDKLDDSAKIIGSVNVVKKENNQLIGYNTDGIGFLRGLLNEYPNSVQNKKIVFLGAGGTTLPIAYELARANAKEIVIINRTIEKAQKISNLISPYAKSRFTGEDEIFEELKTADLVINTSNKGAHPFENYTAFAPITDDPQMDYSVSKKNMSYLPKSAIVADILLEKETKTLELAKKLGYKTHDGKSMNLYQAIPALKIMIPELNNYKENDLEKIMRNAL